MPQTRDITLFLVPGFAADEDDSSCLPAVKSYIAAYARIHPDRDVHVIAFQYPFVRRSYRWHGCTVHAMAGGNRGGLRRIRTWSAAFATALRLGRIACIHSFWLGECTFLGQWLRRARDVPHVASIGGQDARSGNTYLSWLGLGSMRVTAGSSFAAGVYETSTGRAVDAIVPIGLDPGFLEVDGGGIDADIDLLGVGSLIPLKRYDAFVDITARLVPDCPDLRAVIVGDGPERERLQRRIDAAGLQNHIRLAGKKSRADVRRYMLRSRVLLHPSEYEAQGYVFLEALASGLYVVSLDVGFDGGHAASRRCTSDAELRATVRRVLRSDAPPRGHVLSVDESVARFDELVERTASRNEDS